MANQHHEFTLKNGLQLLVEPMAGVRSAAFTLLTPGGSARQPADAAGSANLLCNLVTRGAGEQDSRALAETLDNLGVQRSESTEIMHAAFTAATLAENLVPALSVAADIVRRPMLDEEQFEFCKAMALQELEAIEDEPSQKTFIELKARALPEPLGRSTLGDAESVENCSIETLAKFHRESYQAGGSILGVAGAVDPKEIFTAVDRLFGDWESRPLPEIKAAARTPSQFHVEADKVQTQIGLAFEGVSYSDPDFFNAHGAVGVLSGGMSARLFTEVREKRGLCYSVSAWFQPLKDRGLMVGYASSNNDRAAQTLEVILAELERLHEGIEVEEVRRVQAGLKSSLIMQEESTAARASVLARNWYHLGRVRSLEEVAREIDNLTPARILGYLERHPPCDYTILTLGPKALELSA